MSSAEIDPSHAPNRRRPRSAEAFRRLADAFGSIADFREFVGCVETALNQAGIFEKAHIDLRIGDPGLRTPVEFPMAQLTVPMIHSGRTTGVMRVAGKRGLRPFNAEDLHLMSSLSTFIASLVGHAILHGDLVRNLEVLRRMLEMAPVAVVGLDSKGVGIVASRRAREWLCDDEGASLEAVVNALRGAKVGVENAGRMHVRLHGRLMVADSTNLIAGDDGPVACAVVIHDLTPEQGRLLDGFQRELFRCQLVGRSLTFMLLESAEAPDSLFKRLPDIAANLGPDDVVGPYDGNRIGAVLSGSGEREVVELLRRIRPLLATGDVRVGLAAMGPTVRDTEPLLQMALSSMTPVSEIVRPRVLVHDDYPAVADMLELILKSRYRIVKSTSVRGTIGHLENGPFDGFVTELDLKESIPGLELARRAVEMQPGLRTFFTASAARVRQMEDDPLLRGSPLLPKPFDVREVVGVIESAIPLN